MGPHSVAMVETRHARESRLSVHVRAAVVAARTTVERILPDHDSGLRWALVENMKQCETIIKTYQPFRIGLGDGCRESAQCPNVATMVVTVRGQGRMFMCDACLPKFREYATLPFTIRKLKKSTK